MLYESHNQLIILNRKSLHAKCNFAIYKFPRRAGIVICTQFQKNVNEKFSRQLFIYNVPICNVIKSHIC